MKSGEFDMRRSNTTLHWASTMVLMLLSTVATACGSGGGSTSTTAPTAPSGPTLAVVAFGDSITSGVGASMPYPAKLQSLLSTTYTNGPVVVANYGAPGELASAGVTRLAGALTSKPRIVVIMEGVNDLNATVNDPTSPYGLQTASAALDAMVKTSAQAGAVVALLTVPPERPGWLLLSGRAAQSPGLVDALNNEIRRIAAADGAHLVDVAAAFAGDLSLISGDGLHPTQAGYDLIAQTCFDVLRRL